MSTKLISVSARFLFGVEVDDEMLSQLGCEDMGDLIDVLEEMHPLDLVKLLMDLDELFGCDLDIKT